MDSELGSVKSLYMQLLDAWNARDAAAFAGLFAPHGAMVGFDGSAARGPAEIEAHLSPIFRDHPTARYVTIVRDLHEIADGVALLQATVGMVPPGEQQLKPERNALQVLLASREGEQADWRIEMFQNTPAAFHGRPDDARKLTEELQAQLDRTGAETLTA